MIRLSQEEIDAIADAVVDRLNERREQVRVEEAKERSAYVNWEGIASYLGVPVEKAPGLELPPYTTCDLCEDGVERTGSLHRMQHEHNGSTYYIGCPDAGGE